MIWTVHGKNIIRLHGQKSMTEQLQYMAGKPKQVWECVSLKVQKVQPVCTEKIDKNTSTRMILQIAGIFTINSQGT